ncbi:hypothetical protein [Giesbergeria anulus]|uniref:DUF2628 domain-containing protein n=1 Tax=Giesbergeria anulus TaxID=180197 RepID=A0A1H9RTQ0_9BURK|nr:hypothetical protein [Giesbergeria anulus]SER76240.1 hypothetical protein SAMN02982919_02967 [Giesbergeria anulus]
MANNTIYFENPRTGQMKEAPVGFSWTTFFFGPFPMLFRGSWKWFAIILIIAIITWGLGNLVFMFIINKFYIKDLVSDGFKAKSVKIGTLEQVSMSVGFPVPVLEATTAA